MTTPTSNLPREFWTIATEVIPLVLAGTPAGESTLGRATIVATLITLHLWVAARSGRPAIPSPPSAEDLEALWLEYGDMLWSVAAEAAARRIAADDDALLDPSTPDGRALRILVAEWQEVQHATAFDWRVTSDLIEEATTFWWRASRFLMFRALLRGEPFGFDR